MSVVTDEMVEAAFRAARQGHDALAPGWMQRALAAVAPLIAAQERERCAKVAEAHQAEVQRSIDDNVAEVRFFQMVPSDNWPLIKARDWLKHTAAAIRALGDET